MIKQVTAHYCQGGLRIIKKDVGAYKYCRNSTGTLFATGADNLFADGALVKIKTRYGMDYHCFDNVLLALDYLKK